MESNNLFRNNQVLINAYGIVKLFKGLSFKAVGSYNYSGGDNWNFYGNKARYMPDGVTLITLTGYDPAQTLFVQDQQSTELRLQNYLTYNWKNEVHNLTLMAGFEVSTWGGTWANATAKGFQAPNIRQVSLTNNLASRSGDAQVQDKSNNVSYFGRLNYSFKDRYIITASLREDGSSNFGVGNQFGIFPSAAVAWRISEEDFLKGNPTISNLKLRLSWGETGNAGSQALLGVAQLNPNITNSGGSSPADYKTYPVNGMSGLSSNATENYGIVPSMIDTNLKWETDVEENIGIDLGLYKNWTISAEFFNKISENLLLNKGTRISTGYPSVYTNYGSIQNKGYELMVNYKNNINKDWFFNGTATFSTVTNRVIQLGVDQYAQNTGGTGDGSNLGPVHSSDGVHWDQSSLMREGYAVGTFYGYKVLGIIQSQQQIDALNANAAAKGLGHYQQAYTQPGDFLYMNTTGTGNVTIADRKPLGNGFPKLVYGFNFNLGYKSWDFSCATSGVMGVKILSYSAMELTDFYGSDAGTLPNLLSENSQKAWTPTNHSTTVPRLSILDFNDNMACNSAWVKNGDYFKVRNVQLGYNLPKNLLKPLHIQSSRINISIDNVITISSYRKYGDPEVGQGSPLFTGVDGGRYPFPRTYSVGLNLQF
jgi:TonB-linked SusC/RagA family outer membrane protein